MTAVYVMSSIEARVLADIRYAETTIAELAVRLGYTRRDVEEAVEGLRLAGEPIVAGPRGLRYVTEPDELATYIEGRRRRMASIYMGSRALRGTLRRLRERNDLTLGF